MTEISTTDLDIVSYPRTGKRGVPQQFPRRLYLMLESEAKLEESSADYLDIISWSDSGKAFKITNSAAFASEILPKYFRTSKFSSFQRNLNLVSVADHRPPFPFTCLHLHNDRVSMTLTIPRTFILQYGFTKVRRGPDMDMYHHPSFIRGHAEMLGLLRKSNATGGSKASKKKSRAVSPSPPASPYRQRNIAFVQNNVHKASSLNGSKFFLTDSSRLSHRSACDPATKLSGTGRLDLLTMALTTLAECDSV